jgi:mannose-6-phosphate isomerase
MALIRFQPLYMDRVWGGRWLQEKFGRPLPDGVPIGESWEVVDRPEAQSLALAGVPAGTSLHELWTGSERTAIFGTSAPQVERFPILVKLLDAADKLSLQVHPPAPLAPKFNGEPKTEMWYLLDTRPGADLFVGLRPGMTRARFEEALQAGRVADCFHRVEVKPGDCMFLPSGRVHAIGAGNLIAEIQQNSDTTFRVYDWDRVGLDGKPRALHIQESLECIAFQDEAPALQPSGADPLVRCDYFTTRALTFSGTFPMAANPQSMTLVSCVKGELQVLGEKVAPGDWALVRADVGAWALTSTGEATALCVTWP